MMHWTPPLINLRKAIQQRFTAALLCFTLLASTSTSAPNTAPAQESTHWAYQTLPSTIPLPPISNPSAARNQIDHFVFRKLGTKGLSLGSEAEPALVLRRLHLSLTGLPPSLAELDSHLADLRPDALERAVDRLLAAPQYGEHWGRHWLDLARYADTNGYNIDVGRSIWPFRDWVIAALNSNMPFDRFTIHQLAGDMLPQPTRSQRIATGFHRNTMINQEGGVDPEEDRVKTIVDRVNTTATVWLATTLACSQCHDHFYDPFSQREFFQFYAFFNNTTDRAGGEPNTDLSPVIYLPSAAQQKELDQIRHQLQNLPATETEQKQQLLTEQAALLKTSPSTLVLQEKTAPRATHIHVRGDFLNAGEEVHAALPTVLRFPQTPSAEVTNRLHLARWLVSAENPLTSRVTVNRFWQRFFGTGIVATSDDFGMQGESPTHPQLLDWLARDFVRSGWNIKHLHRRIASSATYCQSAQITPSLLRLDPENRLLARGPRFRMAAETMRDSALAISGLLQNRIGGPSVHPVQPAGFWLEFGTKGFGMEEWPTDSGAARYRRGLYTFWRRTSAYPSFTTFDAPSREHCTSRRPRTNTPLQALTTLNDPTFVETAIALGNRLMTFDGLTVSQKITRGFQLCVARKPRRQELQRLEHFLETQRIVFQEDPQAAHTLVSTATFLPTANLNVTDLAAWTILSNLLLNLDETITK